MKKLLFALFLLATPAAAQQGAVVGPIAPCSAFGTTSGTCFQGNNASTALSDVTAATTWTPTDTSAAGLTFTSVTGNYSKGNKTCAGNFRLTFPSTANGAGVQVSLPCTVANNGSPAIGTCFSTAISPNAQIILLGIANSSNAQLINQTGSATQTTNVNLSTAVLTCMFAFITT